MVDGFCRDGWRCTVYPVKPCLAGRIPPNIHGESHVGDVTRGSFVQYSLRHSFRHGCDHAARRRMLPGGRVLATNEAFVFRRRGSMASSQTDPRNLTEDALRAKPTVVTPT